MATKDKTVTELTDEELAAETMRRAAAKQDEANAAFIASVQPLVDAGWGKEKGEAMIKALEDNFLDLPRGGGGDPDIRVHADAVKNAGRNLQNALANRLKPAPEITPPPTPAAA